MLTCVSVCGGPKKTLAIPQLQSTLLFETGSLAGLDLAKANLVGQ